MGPGSKDVEDHCHDPESPFDASKQSTKVMEKPVTLFSVQFL